MKKETHNTISDFLEDDSFKNWALNKQLSDVSFWNNWIKNNTDKKHLAHDARDILVGIQFKKEAVSDEKIDFEWNKLATKIKNTQNTTTKENSFKNNRFWNYSIVATVLVLISLGFFSYHQFYKITHSTSFGETLELKLNDGTLVTLNSNSSISYKKSEPRKVCLQGEAYFSVHKEQSTNAKFWVNTNDLSVEVYGTQFNVKSSLNQTNVFLEEGNILLNLKNGNSKNMIPGNYIEYSSKEKKLLIDNQIAFNQEHTSWIHGLLVFNNFTLEKALTKVADTYGVTFKYKTPETKNLLITGTVPTTNLDICLKAIQKSTDIVIKKENSILTVEKK